MSGWVARRFWKEVHVRPVGQGFGILLDTRPLRSPAKNLFDLPTRALAEAVAEEWRAVDGAISPATMPVTRAANSAIDKVTPQFDEVAGLIAAYGGSDMLCYRAEMPPELHDAQAAAWDPMLLWAGERLGAPLIATRGIVPVAQPSDSLERLDAVVRDTTPFGLTALHDLVSLTGSLVLGVASTYGKFDPEALWRLARFDEDWQAEKWGRDEEAAALALCKHEEYLRARHFWYLAAGFRE